MQIDVYHRQITVKIVYYGPAMSGKTTNLKALHNMIHPSRRGNLMTLETKDDRTLFFDLLPLVYTSSSGVQMRVKLFTVPGQVIHDATRRIVLQGADGVAFVADSQSSQLEENAASFQNLAVNLADNGLDLRTLPLVIQFNKRDMKSIRSDEEIDTLAALGREPVYKAVATSGVGVAETFMGLFQLTWNGLEGQHEFGTRFNLRASEIGAYMESLLGGEPAGGR